MGNFFISSFISQQSAGFGHDPGSISSDQFENTCVNTFRPLSDFAQHQAGFAKPGGFFLNTTGIGENEPGIFK